MQKISKKPGRNGVRAEESAPPVPWSVHFLVSECCHIKSLSRRVTFQHIDSHVPHSGTHINNSRPIRPLPMAHILQIRNLKDNNNKTPQLLDYFFIVFCCFHVSWYFAGFTSQKMLAGHQPLWCHKGHWFIIVTSPRLVATLPARCCFHLMRLKASVLAGGL